MENSTSLISRFKKYLSTSGRELSTIKSYTSDIKHFTSFLNLKEITHEKAALSNLETFIDTLKYEKKESRNSIRRKIISIRQFYRFLSESNIIDENPFLLSIIPDRKETLPKLLSQKNIKSIFDLAEKHPNKIKSARDISILSLLTFEGLKVSELIELQWVDFIEHEEGGSLSIKGAKTRVLLLENTTSKKLKHYKKILSEQEKESLKPKNKKSIFIAFKGKELETQLEKITRHGLKFFLYEIGLAAHIKNLNTELLRHYAIAHLLETKPTLEAVKRHLGLKRAGNILKHLAKNKQRQSHE